FAFQLLVEKIGEDGEIFVTDLARQVKNSYKEIYIDEYQDTNKLQDIIFKSISTEQSGSINGNRFMVGDIKQSIYAFRGAKSDIFANYSKLFAEYDKNNNDTGFIPQKIYLRKNFRSSYNIISFINYIFANLFSENLGGMEYTGGEVLDVGRIFADEETDKSSVDVTFAIVEKGGDEAVDDETPEEPVGAESISARGFSPDVDSNLRAEIDSAPTQDNTPETQILSTEAEYIALTVKKLLAHGKLKNGENILPRHITILMRNYTKSDLYIDALKRHGIACYTDKSKGFLGSAEIMLIVSLLRTIDNPMRDIDLTAVLKSPVFGFNLDDLIYIKRFNLNSEYTGVVSSEKNDDLKLNALDEYIDPLFRYIRLYAEYDDGIVELKNKCHNFMAKLNQWRAKSRILSVDKFIWYLYRQTDIMAKISLETFAPERKANLMLLYEYARKFESTTFKGLYEFLDYLNDIQSGKNDLERAKVISENSDVVRVMSVHKSKGLEFPVCILANTSGLFNRSDYLGNPVISDDGIYFDLKYKDEIGTEKTPFKKLVAEKVKREVVSEEARILYVALTRAIEKLIIVGNVDNIENYLQKNTVTGDDGTALTSLLSGADNALKWLTPILLNSDGTNKTNPAVNFNIDFVNAVKLNQMIANQRNEDLLAQNLELTGEELSESDLETIDEYGKKLKEMYDFKYKFSLLSKIPLKLSVTNLSPVGAESISARAFSPDVGSNTPEYSEPEMAPLPRFLENEADDVAILRGTATHLFMQYADFEYAEVFGAQNEAENLLSKEFITEPQYDRIKFDSVDKFFGSDLYQKIKSAKKIYREMPFHLKISVADLIKMNNIGAGESLNFVQQVHLKDLEELPEYSEDFLLIQGAIDLFFEDKDGNVYVVDFKTDYVRSDEGENILVKRHKRQIEYYCKAVQAILNKPVSGAYIYSFSLNKAVEVAVGDIN
ncbi:MAG: UvrD-helicase domain-containing protein, partial [Oscillospiraceae bacterium]|nr:UvrD-helicase domain-containing protein [Oscillospiraceae bacterium]